VERNRKAGQNPPRVVASTEEEEAIKSNAIAEIIKVSVWIQIFQSWQPLPLINQTN
jgi:hypothetical protein